jgi:hypothetical protein
MLIGGWHSSPQARALRQAIQGGNLRTTVPIFNSMTDEPAAPNHVGTDTIARHDTRVWR